MSECLEIEDGEWEKFAKLEKEIESEITALKK